MLLSSRYSTPGFWTRDSLYLLHVDSVASSLRILVTFAIVLEVRGIFFFQIPWTTYGRCLLDQKKITIRVLLRSSPFINRDSASSTFLHGLSGRNMLNSFDMLIYAPTTQKIVCFFELSLFSCFLTFVYQLIVKSMCQDPDSKSHRSSL